MSGRHVIAGAILGLALVAGARGQAGEPAPGPTTAERVGTVLDLAATGGATKARAALEAILAEQVASAAFDDAGAFTLPAAWVRLSRIAQALPAERERTLLARLREHEAFALALAFLWRPEGERPKPLAEVVERVLTERAAMAKEFPGLAAAVCVVGDGERAWEFGVSPDPVAVLDYFAEANASLVLPVRDTPPELLVYVVDTLVGPEQLRWALAKYGTGTQVGRRYAEVPYDRAHYPGGAPLRLASTRGTLEDMLRAGGVCRHQAHYAAHTAKAQGIPAVVVRGAGSGVSHAWLGFLEVKGDRARWNFDTGRFGEYAEMTGTVTDPQTRKAVSDGRLALVARAVREPPDRRRLAAALTDASRLVGQAKSPYPPQGVEVPASRQGGAALRATLLEAAVNACPAYAPAWDELAGLAGDLPRDEAGRWGRAVVTLCGSEYPDFAVEILLPVIRAMKDAPEQDRLLTWAMDQFSGTGAAGRGGSKGPPRRADLAARIRFEQGATWEAAGEPARAWEAYADVIDRFANNGPFAVEAAARAEALLVREGKPASDVLALYARAFGKVRRPEAGTSPEFLMAGNHARLGARYADLLEKAGQSGKAEQVRRTLPAAPAKKP